MYCVYSPFSYSHYSWLLYWIKRLMHDGGGRIGPLRRWKEESKLCFTWINSCMGGVGRMYCLLRFSANSISELHDHLEVVLHDNHCWPWGRCWIGMKDICVSRYPRSSVLTKINSGHHSCARCLVFSLINLRRCRSEIVLSIIITISPHRPLWQRRTVPGESVVSSRRLLGTAG